MSGKNSLAASFAARHLDASPGPPGANPSPVVQEALKGDILKGDI